MIWVLFLKPFHVLVVFESIFITINANELTLINIYHVQVK